MNLNRTILRAMLIAAITASVALAVAGEKPEPAAEKSTVPPSTNPTGRVLFPGEGQGEEQQLADQLECYRWASDQMKWDPYEAYDVLVEKGYAAAKTAEEAQGGLISGAARGAAAGVIIGAIAGDAGKGAAIGAAAGGLSGGMRSRRARASAQAAADEAIGEFSRNLEKWDRNYSACMTGKDYTVN